MNGAFLRQESLLYYATISCNDKNYKPKLSKGSCETSFKKRYSNHKKIFNAPLYKQEIKLSTEYLGPKNETTKLKDIFDDESTIKVLKPNFKTL